jgi:acyl carrier protein
MVATTLAAVGDIWRNVLGEESTPPSDVNFFDAGGTSLALLRMQAMLNERFHVDIGGVDLFEHTTIEKLAAFIDKLAPNDLAPVE